MPLKGFEWENVETNETYALLSYDEWSYMTMSKKLTNTYDSDLVVLTPEECKLAKGFMSEPVALDDGIVIEAKTRFTYDILPEHFDGKYIYQVSRATRTGSLKSGDGGREEINGYMVRIGEPH